MRFTSLGNAKQFGSATVRNKETAITIKSGAPVFYKSGGTKLGLDAVSVQGLAAANQLLFAGIAMAEMTVNSFGDAFSYGIAEGVRYVTTSRSATDAVWPSAASHDIGEWLDFESNSNTTDAVQAVKSRANGNLFVASVASRASLASDASIPSFASVAGYSNIGLELGIRLAQSLASIASVASDSDATDAARLFRTTTIQAIIRAL